MSRQISISYIWDKETFLKAAKSAYKHELKNSGKRYIGWLFIAMAQFGVVAAMKKGAVGLLLISSILLVYWYLLRWPLRKFIISKSFDKSPYANKKFNIKIYDDKIEINTESIKWDKISQVIFLESGFLLYTDQKSFFFPSGAFKDMEEKNKFAAMAKKRVKNYQISLTSSQTTF